MTMVPMCCPRCGDMWHVGIGCRNPNCPNLAPLDPLADRVIEAFRQLTPEETAARREVYRKVSALLPRPAMTAEGLHKEATRLGYVVIPKEVAKRWLEEYRAMTEAGIATGVDDALADALKEDKPDDQPL